MHQKCSRIVKETVASHAQGKDKSRPNRPAESLNFLHGTEIKAQYAVQVHIVLLNAIVNTCQLLSRLSNIVNAPLLYKASCSYRIVVMARR